MCSDCDPVVGNYSNHDGASECSKCVDGTYSNGTACIPCPAGTAGEDGTCSVCDSENGEYSSQGDTECVDLWSEKDKATGEMSVWIVTLFILMFGFFVYIFTRQCDVSRSRNTASANNYRAVRVI